MGAKEGRRVGPAGPGVWTAARLPVGRRTPRGGRAPRPSHHPQPRQPPTRSATRARGESQTTDNTPDADITTARLEATSSLPLFAHPPSVRAHQPKAWSPRAPPPPQAGPGQPRPSQAGWPRGPTARGPGGAGGGREAKEGRLGETKGRRHKGEKNNGVILDDGEALWDPEVRRAGLGAKAAGPGGGGGQAWGVAGAAEMTMPCVWRQEAAEGGGLALPPASGGATVGECGTPIQLCAAAALTGLCEPEARERRTATAVFCRVGWGLGGWGGAQEGM